MVTCMGITKHEPIRSTRQPQEECMYDPPHWSGVSHAHYKGLSGLTRKCAPTLVDNGA